MTTGNLRPLGPDTVHRLETGMVTGGDHRPCLRGAAVRGAGRSLEHRGPCHHTAPAETRGSAETVPGPAPVRLRHGSVHDVEALRAMHERCSAETLRRRYHVPVPHLSRRLARALLLPTRGLSVVATAEDQVVAIGVLAADSATLELGLLVEDRWQHQGLGTRLLRCLAEHARDQHATHVLCLIQPDNTGVLRTIRRAGFQPDITAEDGVLHCDIPLTGAPPRTRRRRRSAMGVVTAPLVSLLHERAELRSIYPPADFLDQAVRGGA